ncbi:MAG: shikimate kinase [Clostridia bacterium]|nr:shikimate kinase [Clostridia bacterium]
MNLILCGMMGAGKTTLGVKIADKTGRRWYDTDGMIVDRHGRISDIFEYYGEEHFRRLESNVVRELSQKDDLILSTGGGLVLRPENSELLKKNGKIVFLRASLETLIGRLKIYEDRPLLQGDSSILAAKLSELLKERTPIYESVSDYIVDVDGKTAEENAEAVISIAKECFASLQPTERR